MSHRKRWTLGLFAGLGGGVCAAGLAMLLMTGLDQAFPGESLPSASATGAQSMSQGSTIGLFLGLSIVLITIALGASVVDGRNTNKSAPAPAPAPRRGEIRKFRTGRILVQRQ